MRLLTTRLCGSRAFPLRTHLRLFSSISTRNRSATPKQPDTAESPNDPLNSRWLSDLRSRIKKIQDTSPNKAKEAQAISQDINSRWLGLLAGPEGFLTSQEWRALDGREIIWGDIVSGQGQFISLLKWREANPSLIWSTRRKGQHGHVNNLVYNRFAEAGRVNWMRHHGEGASPVETRSWDELITPLSVGLILKNINTMFKFPMTFPDRATVLFKLAERPNFSSDSLELEAVIFSEAHQRLAARCVESNAIYDYREAKKTPLPGFMVEKFQETFDKQVEARHHYYGKALEVIRAVEELRSTASD